MTKRAVRSNLGNFEFINIIVAIIAWWPNIELKHFLSNCLRITFCSIGSKL